MVSAMRPPPRYQARALLAYSPRRSPLRNESLTESRGHDISLRQTPRGGGITELSATQIAFRCAPANFTRDRLIASVLGTHGRKLGRTAVRGGSAPSRWRVRTNAAQRISGVFRRWAHATIEGASTA